jgi:2-dehydro-3-deoxy-D-arabinonate dehydratase
MPPALFRIRDADGEVRLAAGDPADGPRRLLPSDRSLDDLLASGADLSTALAEADEPIEGGVTVLAPVEGQEVWAAGVTYARSRDARAEETRDRSPYDLVYDAERPELFEKSAGWRVRGPNDAIGIRRDSEWNVPEPELALVLDATMRVVGYTVGDDVSSRSIEGENTLYLPQAKVYEGSCALGPAIVPVAEASPPFAIALRIARGGEVVYDEATTTERMVRPFEELAAWLGYALAFPVGAILLTGTGLVPPSGFTLMERDRVRIEIEGVGVLENVVELVGGAATPTTSSAPAR